jgi:hypothetical protein
MPSALRITAKREQGLRGGPQQERKHRASMREGQGAERRRQREDDVEVVDVEHPGHALVDPTRLREILALRTVPITTRVVRRSLEAAGRAHVDMAAQGGRPADGDCPEGLPLLA